MGELPNVVPDGVFTDAISADQTRAEAQRPGGPWQKLHSAGVGACRMCTGAPRCVKLYVQGTCDKVKGLGVALTLCVKSVSCAGDNDCGMCCR